MTYPAYSKFDVSSNKLKFPTRSIAQNPAFAKTDHSEITKTEDTILHYTWCKRAVSMSWLNPTCATVLLTEVVLRDSNKWPCDNHTRRIERHKASLQSSIAASVKAHHLRAFCIPLNGSITYVINFKTSDKLTYFPIIFKSGIDSNSKPPGLRTLFHSIRTYMYLRFNRWINNNNNSGLPRA